MAKKKKSRETKIRAKKPILKASSGSLSKPIMKFSPRGRSASTIGAAAGNSSPVVELQSVAFAEGWVIQKDDGSGAYGPPQWQKGTPPTQYPYLYAASPIPTP